jgi:hypothetical protein
MSDLILTDEQAKALSEAVSAVPMRDPGGNLVGYASPTPAHLAFTPEQIAEREKRLDSDGPWSTTREMLNRIRRAPGR